MSKRPNSYENFFAEPFRYGDGYGYAVIAKTDREAIDKIVEDLSYVYDGYTNSEEILQRLKREIRENMRECWVKWQGFVDDDGQFANGWVIMSKMMGGVKGWKPVWESDFDRHYVKYGHRLEPKADERGHRVNYSFSEYNCDVCNQIERLQQRIKDFESNQKEE